MLQAKRCPHTGILNYFDEDEPHLSVGSIARCGRQAETVVWRCYMMTETAAGTAPDVPSAHRRLLASYAEQVSRPSIQIALDA